ncbi:MAG: 2-hydroxyglutaryl-CoA dehydratase [Ruminococcaceae bacterium]|nr:2-hydroxyglutaryl-CoA dehydratase [Oscillospiraceae bacterium]
MSGYLAGIDIGSTTVKLVILNENKNIIYSKYRRHGAHTKETLLELLFDAKNTLGSFSVSASITGSGAINLAKKLEIDFVQEVVATASAVEFTAPHTDVAIELGGEDAKIIYFTGGLEERMNGVCAGGTGSFIDQMAALLQTDATGLNDEAVNYTEIYPIAARCGVFAKTDIQPLINEGATKANLAASIFQAVVNQTISGLACGKPIRGNVAFLGGPLHFLPELKAAFIRTLNLTPETTVDPENSHLFAALGSALESENSASVSVDDLIGKLETGDEITFEMPRLEPLFGSEDEYNEFIRRHKKSVVPSTGLDQYEGDCFLGIDAGSTTTKLVLIGDEGQLLFSYYANNSGNPIKTAINAIDILKKQLPENAKIVHSCSTGYGEALLKAAFSLDEGEVETIAHTTAAKFFCPDLDCVLDIGGQDMKCIKIKNNSVDSVILNEACSSGCGSFIENFANSLGFNVSDFANKALFSDAPVDLGTRCTVFMNSNVKQAQKEGASVSDISAGLAYSVIKNALFKVIKLTSGSELGKNIVVQGGTFLNHAVLRAFEKITGIEAICPDISGLMGAFGAALIAKERYSGQGTTMLSLDEISSLEYTSTSTRCKGCSNNCMLTINKFSGNRRYISGNRCEKGLGNDSPQEKNPNMFEYKRERLFSYTPLPEEAAVRGTVGIPRVLNMYENYPFWAVFFEKLKIRAVLSPYSDRKIYELGMESIPSESECYPAKLSHGHVQWLINQGITTIFHPCVFYEHQETQDAQNHYNCPIVVSYAENLKNNVEDVASGKVKYIRPFIAFTNEKILANRLCAVCRDNWGIPEKEVRMAVKCAWEEQRRAKEDIKKEGKRILDLMRSQGKKGIVLAGRPYHIDPEINHGIPEMIASYGFTVFTEDSLPIDFAPQRPLRVVDQWVYHSRLYSAAEFVTKCNDIELIQLNSFGCGLDAITTDQVCEILENSNKLYTLLKIDEVNNLGAVRIRIRSLIAAIKLREANGIIAKPVSPVHNRVEFTKEMRDRGYTIIAPQMSPIHFDIIEPVFKKHGYNVVVLSNDNRSAIDTGLKYVNNDACFPSITVVGQIMEAVLSGDYDTDKLAIVMAQTGGCCRASNYVSLIRRALEKAELPHIPVLSLNANGMEKNSGFSPSPLFLFDIVKAAIYGDLLMRCLYRVRPYEKVRGAANALHQKWQDICIDSLVNKKSKFKYTDVCRGIVEAFDNFPINEELVKPRVGIVGEILVKYMPLANNQIVNLLEKEGAEAVVPDLIDFFIYCLYNNEYKATYLGDSQKSNYISKTAISVINTIRKPAVAALKKSRRFHAPVPMNKIADLAKPILSIGNQYGEGWFLTGEMAELLSVDVPNIVCIQPFGCLPNHVVGKGVIKALKKKYPDANITAVDYDPGASEVNQLNRIKLMLQTAKKRLPKESSIRQEAAENKPPAIV